MTNSPDQYSVDSSENWSVFVENLPDIDKQFVVDAYSNWFSDNDSSTYHPTAETENNMDDGYPYPSRYGWIHIALSSVVVTVIMAIIVVGNVLVVIAIAVDRHLNTVQNWFIASLAVSDLLVGLFVMPLSLANELMGYWVFGDVLCELWLSTDVLLCTASILNLVLISLDRYWSITRAISYVRNRTRRRAVFMISIVWIVSMVICLPPLFGWKRPQPTKYGYPLCTLSEEPGYVVYSTVGSFYLPLVVMILVYFKIYLAARGHARRNLKSYQKVPNVNPRNKSTSTSATTTTTTTTSSNVGYSAFNKVEFEVSRMSPTREMSSDMSDSPQTHEPLSSEQPRERTSNFKCAAPIYQKLEEQFSNQKSRSQFKSNGGLFFVNAVNIDDVGVTSCNKVDDVIGMKIERTMSLPREELILLNHGGERVSRIYEMTETSEENEVPTKLGQHRHSISSDRFISKISRVTENSNSQFKNSNSNQRFNDVEETAHQNIPANDARNNSTSEHTYAPIPVATLDFSKKSPTEISNIEERRLGNESDYKENDNENNVSHTAIKFDNTSNVLQNTSIISTDRPLNYLDVPHGRPSKTPPCSRASFVDNRDLELMRSKNRRVKASQRAQDVAARMVADPERTKRRIARAKERRATFVLGIVMVSFIGCWLPFFSLYPITLLMDFQVPYMLFAVIFWLGYCNSALNPIIYTIFNRDFRRAFKRLIFGRNSTLGHH